MMRHKPNMWNMLPQNIKDLVGCIKSDLIWYRVRSRQNGDLVTWHVISIPRNNHPRKRACPLLLKSARELGGTFTRTNYNCATFGWFG
jgi:hypothetical protein